LHYILQKTMPSSSSREFSQFLAQSWSIADLPGISAEDCLQLKQLKIATTRDLLRHSMTLEAQSNLAQQLHLHLHHIQKWRALADLAMLPSVGTDYCGLLLHAGVISTSQLASRLPGQLYRQVLKLQVSTLKSPDRCPNAGLVELWIQQAKQLQVARLQQAQKQSGKLR
jgi:Domain of unknown function (DUF4332)